MPPPLKKKPLSIKPTVGNPATRRTCIVCISRKKYKITIMQCGVISYHELTQTPSGTILLGTILGESRRRPRTELDNQILHVMRRYQGYL